MDCRSDRGLIQARSWTRVWNVDRSIYQYLLPGFWARFTDKPRPEFRGNSIYILTIPQDSNFNQWLRARLLTVRSVDKNIVHMVTGTHPNKGLRSCLESLKIMTDQIPLLNQLIIRASAVNPSKNSAQELETLLFDLFRPAARFFAFGLQLLEHLFY